MNDQARRPRRVLSASTVKSTPVKSPDGEDLGKIEELMFDRDTGRMAYAVLSFGGFLGMGDKLFAIPWQAMSLDSDREEVVLPVDKEVLENAPGFDKDRWPDFADPTWHGQIHEYYGTEPYWAEDAAPGRGAAPGGDRPLA